MKARILILISSLMVGCSTSQITAGWETAKARSQVGLGIVVRDGTWTGPLQFTWLSEPKPDAPRLGQVITPQK